MTKWLCFVIVFLLLIPVNGMNEKENVMGSIDEMQSNNGMLSFHASNPFHSFISDFIYGILIKMKNYPPVALMKGMYEGMVREPLTFDASSSYDPNGDALKYRWDFDNDGIYDTAWLSYPKIKHVYYEPYDGFVKLQVKDEHGLTDECIARVIVKNTATAPITGEVDQKQEKADGYVKIYGGKKYAQSFKPSMIGFNGFDILIERKGIASYENNRMSNALHRIGRILSRFFGRGSMVSFLSKSSSNAEITSFFVGDLVVGLYKDLSYSGKIFEKSFSPAEISRSRSWLHIEFDTELDPRETYYIVVYQTGGSEWQYYKWYYGSNDPYDRGSSYNYDGGWNEDKSKDFCFKTYGYKTGDEPDGVEERWAVIFGCLDTFMGISYYSDANAYDLRDTLISHGWDSSHVKVVISPAFNDVKNAMEWIASVDDMDDIILVSWSSHGGKYGFAVKDMAVQYQSAMGPWLDECRAKGIFIPIETCGSGGAIQFLAKEGRVDNDIMQGG